MTAAGARVVAVIAVGGVLGSELRYGVGLLLPAGPPSFPWATLLVNVVGGFGMGLLGAALDRAPHPLLRAFVGVGVLGGFTTFSAYSLDTVRLLAAGAPATAVGYVLLTLVAALAATVAGHWAGHRAGRPGARTPGQ